MGCIADVQTIVPRNQASAAIAIIASFFVEYVFETILLSVIGANLSVGQGQPNGHLSRTDVRLTSHGQLTGPPSFFVGGHCRRGLALQDLERYHRQQLHNDHDAA